MNHFLIMLRLRLICGFIIVKISAFTTYLFLGSTLLNTLQEFGMVLSASKVAPLLFPVTTSKQSTIDFLKESTILRAASSQTQICIPLPPEKTYMNFENPKSSSSERVNTYLATSINFQHREQIFLPEQHVRTSSQSFISKSKINYLCMGLNYLLSLAGGPVQTAPASTFLGGSSSRDVILAFISWGVLNLTQRWTLSLSYSKESSRWSKGKVWLQVSQVKMA